MKPRSYVALPGWSDLRGCTKMEYIADLCTFSINFQPDCQVIVTGCLVTITFFSKWRLSKWIAIVNDDIWVG